MIFRCLLSLLFVSLQVFASSLGTGQLDTIRLIPIAYSQNEEGIVSKATKLLEDQSVTCYLDHPCLYVVIKDSVFYQDFLQENRATLDSLNSLEKDCRYLFLRGKRKKI